MCSFFLLFTFGKSNRNRLLTSSPEISFRQIGANGVHVSNGLAQLPHETKIFRMGLE